MTDTPIQDAAVKVGITVIAVYTLFVILNYLYVNFSTPGEAFYPLRQVIQAASDLGLFLVPGAGLGLTVILYLWTRDDDF